MSDAKHNLSHLTELAHGLGLHEHLCLIYTTQEEQLAAALPFLKSGLARGEKCFIVANKENGTGVLSALREAGTDVDGHVKSGDLILAVRPYVEPTRFEPHLCISFLSQSIDGTSDDSLSELRKWLEEMTWAQAEETKLETLIEFEAKVNSFVRDHDVRALCQYHRQRFSPELLLGIIRTHPLVVYGGATCQNPYFVPPEDVLKPNQASREVERLLNNMLAQEQALAQLRALAGRLQKVREEERTTVAREIHDELGQALTAIKIDFTSLIRDLPADREPPSRRTQSILKLLDQAIQSVQRIGTELRPRILDDMGLLAALEWAAEDFQARTGTQCEISLPAIDTPLDPEQATALFRIFQETLTNVARHAQATRVGARLGQQNGNLILEVRDNGKGITEEQLSSKSSLGILGMRERVLVFGGELTISGTPGVGTTVRVLIPNSRPARSMEI